MPSERLRYARNLLGPPPPARDELRAHLERLSKDDLIDLLLERSLHDATLACELGVRAVADTRDGRIDVPAMKREIDRTTDSHGYVDWRAVGMYADGVEDVVDALERYAAGGDDRASDVSELAEYALVRLDDAMGHVQDDGDLEPAIKRLHTLHLAACVRSNPDPIALARRLFEHELTSGFGFFHRAEEVYAEVLGAAGSSEYRRLAEAEWAKIPALGPGWREPPGIPNRHKIAAIVERLARATGDVEAVVAVLVRDLSASDAYLRIAREYARAGAVEKARLWIDKGIKAFGRTPDPRLAAFLETLEGAHRGVT